MMKKEKLVSIILPVYNGADNIRNAIDSIVNQTYQNWELIIVNDCSTDNTLEIVTEYQSKDKRITIINNIINLKLPRTLNVGFAAAQGEYFTWTSDDNMYKPEAISKMVETLEANHELSMVYANYTNINGAGQILDEVILSEPEELVTGNVIGACFLYTKTVAQKAGQYDSNLFLAEDYDYWIQIFRCGKIKHISDNLYFYRRHGGSLTETKKDMIDMQTYLTLEKNFLFLYTAAKKLKKQYVFFDHMLKRVPVIMRNDMLTKLKLVDSGYSIYLKKEKIKSSVISIYTGLKYKKD